MVFAKVDGWEDTLMSLEWGVRGYPTLILMHNDGTEIDRVPGYLPPADFIQTMDDYIAGKGTLDDLLNQLASKPDSLQLYMDIGEKYQYRGMDSAAESYYADVMEKDPSNKSNLADDALFQLAMVAFGGGEENYDSAVARFEQIGKKYPKSEQIEEADIYIPYIMARQGKNAEAIARYEQFLAKFPESGEVEWVKGQIEKLKDQGT